MVDETSLSSSSDKYNSVAHSLAMYLNITEDNIPDACRGVVLAPLIWVSTTSRSRSSSHQVNKSHRHTTQLDFASDSTSFHELVDQASPDIKVESKPESFIKCSLEETLRSYQGPMPMIGLNTTIRSMKALCFVQGAYRARAEVVLTTGARIRETPVSSWSFGDTPRMHRSMCQWRHELGRPDKLCVCVMSDEGFDLDNPGFHADHVEVVVLTTNIKLAQQVIIHRRQHPKFSVYCLRELTPSSALVWLQQRYNHISLEVGPSVSNDFFRGAAPNPVMIDSLWIGAYCDTKPPPRTQLHIGVNVEEITDFFHQNSTPPQNNLNKRFQSRPVNPMTPPTSPECVFFDVPSHHLKKALSTSSNIANVAVQKVRFNFSDQELSSASADSNGIEKSTLSSQYVADNTQHSHASARRKREYGSGEQPQMRVIFDNDQQPMSTSSSDLDILPYTYDRRQKLNSLQETKKLDSPDGILFCLEDNSVCQQNAALRPIDTEAGHDVAIPSFINIKNSPEWQFGVFTARDTCHH